MGGLLLLGIYFASVSTTLYINGTLKLSADTEDFEKNVIFKTSSVDSDSLDRSYTGTDESNEKSFTITFTCTLPVEAEEA